MSVGAAKITSAGKVIQLNAKAEPDSIVTEADVQSPRLLAKLLTGILAELATLRRRFAPRRIDFEDVACTGTAIATQSIPLRHGFNGRVRWNRVDWVSGSVSALAIRKDDANTTTTTLVLLCNSTGTLSVRVEEAG